tara:strand:- start:335 stop:661 length:327 start_codon:yes stop_codon:yes gene_type:complete
MPKKKPYYPNNWEAYKNTPSDWFESMSYEDFMDWKIGGWEMPSSVSCMIRETNTKTGKVKEYVYEREHAAEKKAREIMRIGESEFVVCTPDKIHFMTPKLEGNYDEDP